MRKTLPAVLPAIVFVIVVGLVAQEKPAVPSGAGGAPPKAAEKAAPAKPTALTKAEHDEMTDLLVDLQNARLAKVNLDEAIEKAKKAADETISTAQTAYLKRLRELQKEHKAEGWNLSLRQEWTEPPKQP